MEDNAFNAMHESKEYLNEVLARMQEKAKELNLEFNQKTQIMPISEGVDFLGFQFYLTDTGKVIWRLRNKVMGSFVLTHASKNKEGMMAYDNMKGSQS